MLPQVVDSRACRPRWNDQLQLGHDVVAERITDRIGVNTVASAPCKERGLWVGAPLRRSARKIGAQHGTQFGSEGDLPALAELAIANEQDIPIEVDVAELQPGHLADPQPEAIQQREDRVVRRPAVPTAIVIRELAGHLEESARERWIKPKFRLIKTDIF